MIDVWNGEVDRLYLNVGKCGQHLVSGQYILYLGLGIELPIIWPNGQTIVVSLGTLNLNFFPLRCSLTVEELRTLYVILEHFLLL